MNCRCYLESKSSACGNELFKLGMCPDQESNLPPFGVWDDNPTNRATLDRAFLSLKGLQAKNGFTF